MNTQDNIQRARQYIREGRLYEAKWILEQMPYSTDAEKPLKYHY